MFPKKRRLQKGLIEKVLKKGKNINSRGISLKYLSFSSQASAFAVVVSTKTVRKAVLRNKLKRRGRAVVVKLLPIIKEGFLVLLFFKKESAEMTFSELKTEIANLFKKAKIIPEAPL